MAQLTQPLKWHGGKYYLRKWIVGLMPPHLHYVEPFFGGGGILLARDPNRDWMATGAEKLPAALKGSSEVVNDLHGELINFWRVLQDAAHFDSFRQRMEMTPFSEAEFDRAFEFSQTGEADRDATDVERARSVLHPGTTVPSRVNERLCDLIEKSHSEPDQRTRFRMAQCRRRFARRTSAVARRRHPQPEGYRRYSQTGRSQHAVLLRSSLRSRVPFDDGRVRI